MPSLNLQSSDNKILKVDYEIVKCSTTIKSMIENLGLDETDEESNETIPLLNVDGTILKIVIDWATQHKDDPEAEEEEVDPYSSKGRVCEVGEWDTEFFTFDKQVLYQISMAANYLDIHPLLSTVAKIIANMLKAAAAISVEEVRQQFNIENDATPEEAAQWDKENEWCDEKK